MHPSGLRIRARSLSWWRRRVMGAALGWLALCAVGALTTERRPAPTIEYLPGPAEARLLCASLPGISAVADHCWFITRDHDADWQRFDVWQETDAGGTSWGHVHRNLQGPLDDVGGGPTRELARLTGAEAVRIHHCLATQAPEYPHRDTYRAWPGPNSNTFVDHLLRTCTWSTTLPTTAIGKDWRGLIGASTTTTGTGVQLETPLIGLRAGLDEGLELHVLTLAFGLDLWPPATLTPFGRLGFPER